MKAHELKTPPGATHRARRVGRGHSAGQGKTSGRGVKGQGARSGGVKAPYFEGGQLPFVRRLPFVRGFVNIYKVPYAPVNLQQLNIAFDDGAVVTACRDPSADRVDRSYGRAEMNGGALPAAFGDQMPDERAIAFPDPPVLAIVPSRPLVAEREGAEAGRVGRVVALDRSCDRPPHLVVSPIGKMRLQKFGDRQIGFHLAHGLVESSHMRR